MSHLLFEIVTDETAQEYMLDVADLVAVGGPGHEECESLTMAVDRIANNDNTHRLVICAQGESGKKSLQLMREKLIAAMKKYGKPNRVSVGTALEPGGDPVEISEVGHICTACKDVGNKVDPDFGLCDPCWYVGCRHDLIGGTKGQPVMAKNGITKISKIVADSVSRETIGGE